MSLNPNGRFLRGILRANQKKNLRAHAIDVHFIYKFAIIFLDEDILLFHLSFKRFQIKVRNDIGGEGGKGWEGSGFTKWGG